MNSMFIPSGRAAAPSLPRFARARRSARMSSSVAFGGYLPTRRGRPNTSQKAAQSDTAVILSKYAQLASPLRMGSPARKLGMWTQNCHGGSSFVSPSSCRMPSWSESSNANRRGSCQMYRAGVHLSEVVSQSISQTAYPLASLSVRPVRRSRKSGDSIRLCTSSAILASLSFSEAASSTG